MAGGGHARRASRRRALGAIACLAAGSFVPAAAASLRARSAVPATTRAVAVSSNWAGYVATGVGSSATTASPAMTYSDVTGRWIEPSAICTGAPTSVALWVGLGGYSVSSNKLEQAGTSADCKPDGTASYYAWYELVPADSVNIDLKIDPGDVIVSSVVASGSKILVQIIDRTRGTRFTRRLTMSAPDLTSAEWIAEAPAECSSGNDCQQFSLTNFNSVTFSRTFAIGNGTSGTITSPAWTATAMQLVPSAHRFFGGLNNTRSGPAGAGASPLALAPDGSGFTIDWQPTQS